MADIFGFPVVAMMEDEGAALGGALQAAWCVGRRERSRATLAELTAGVVAMNEATRCEPARANVRRYRELQALQDQLGANLRTLFTAQRKFVSR
jgi:sugar (pentulose or hexulose) kinase